MNSAEMLSQVLREFADARDKDTGFVTMLTRTMRDGADEIDRLRAEAEDDHKRWSTNYSKAREELAAARAEVERLTLRYVVQTDPIPEKDVERARQFWQEHASKEAGRLDRMTVLEQERDEARAEVERLTEAAQHHADEGCLVCRVALRQHEEQR